MTSSKAVAKLKHILDNAGYKADKIGHMGTLDPDGEGVLPIALGRATRLFDYFLDKKKVYYTQFVFGSTTDTLDGSGTVTETTAVVPSKDDIISVIPSLCGQIDQIPPAYSAKVIGGIRAYKLARAGKDVLLKPKKVQIYSIELLDNFIELPCSPIKLRGNPTSNLIEVSDNPAKEVFCFRIECGGGTYIRSIVRDMAEAVGSLGYMRYIKRLESGGFAIDTALTLEQLENSNIIDNLITVEQACAGFAPYYAPDGLSSKILNGVKVVLPDMPQGDFALYIDGRLAGIACADGENKLIFKTRLI